MDFDCRRQDACSMSVIVRHGDLALADGVGQRAMKSLIIKRSIMIAGRATSISLEEAFWKAFKEIAAGRHLTPSELVDEISAGRKAGSLSSTIRLFVLDFYRNQISAPQQQCDGTSAT
jgi:predicted DNA-binding ribbon-helix-helix protein